MKNEKTVTNTFYDVVYSYSGYSPTRCKTLEEAKQVQQDRAQARWKGPAYGPDEYYQGDSSHIEVVVIQSTPLEGSGIKAQTGPVNEPI